MQFVSMQRGRKKGTGYNYKGVYAAYFNKLKTSAEKRNIPFNLTLKMLGDLWEKQPICPYTGLSLTQYSYANDTCYTASLDRIDSSLGYQQKNIQWVYKPINKMKGNMSHSEFSEIIKEIGELAILKSNRKWN